MPGFASKVKCRGKKERELNRLILAQQLIVPYSGQEPGRDASPPIPHPPASSATIKNEKTESTEQQRGPGAIWALKCSKDGKYLAAGGQDTIVRVWTLIGLKKPDPDDKDQTRRNRIEMRSARSFTVGETDSHRADQTTSQPSTSLGGSVSSLDSQCADPTKVAVYNPHPIHQYKGHQADILDLSWSKVGTSVVRGDTSLVNGLIGSTEQLSSLFLYG